jgi:hypothetical protein
MRSSLGQAQERTLTPQTMPGNGAPATVKEIPYDYVATFTLQGKRGNRVQDVINISTDGAFVAVSIGYSFIPELTKQITIDGAVGNGIHWKVSDVELLTPPSSLAGINVNFLLAGQSSKPVPAPPDSLVNPVAMLQCLLVQTCGLDFKYSITDGGSGRELQNESIHNIAGLGKADGERPFRPLAKPMLFMPRSAIRIEIDEFSEGLLYRGSLLYIVLHGYKMLNYGT